LYIDREDDEDKTELLPIMQVCIYLCMYEYNTLRLSID